MDTKQLCVKSRFRSIGVRWLVGLGLTLVILPIVLGVFDLELIPTLVTLVIALLSIYVFSSALMDTASDLPLMVVQHLQKSASMNFHRRI